MTETNDPIQWYRRMQLIRQFETHLAPLLDSGEIVGAVHEYLGEEAVAVGVCAALRKDDVITSTHRGHGHILAKGGQPNQMFAELLGRESGYNRGRGGSMHIADFSLGIFGANGIVGAGTPMACGAAHSFKLRKENRVAVSFFGDGAMNQGVLMESFNLAKVLELPVVFVCENNGLDINSPTEVMTPGGIEARAKGFGLNAQSEDGMDVRKVYTTALNAVAHARSGQGPTFIEYITERYSIHNISAGDKNSVIRKNKFLKESWENDPIRRIAEEITLDKRWSSEERESIDNQIKRELEDSIKYARKSRLPNPGSALDFMYTDIYPDFPAKGWET